MNDLQAFCNRLQKNRRHWDKWARRRAISCYRIYDRDLAEVPLAIDRYGDQLHLQLFEPRNQPWSEQQELEVITQVANLLECPEGQIHFQRRRRQKGAQQYEKLSRNSAQFTVQESGLEFLVDLQSYLDTGLFLDHRQTRQMVRKMAAGKRFLNLFAYTGSFTVYAAAGGATSSLTVDLSKRYQQWTRDNLQLNGLDNPNHQLLQADVLVFLQQAARQRRLFDLIVMDPPSFSNSKRMKDVLDVQRDHLRMIELCRQLLTPGGQLIFSTNLRRFRLDSGLAQAPWVREITSRTVPEDFRRHTPHRCWQIVRDD